MIRWSPGYDQVGTTDKGIVVEMISTVSGDSKRWRAPAGKPWMDESANMQHDFPTNEQS